MPAVTERAASLAALARASLPDTEVLVRMSATATTNAILVWTAPRKLTLRALRAARLVRPPRDPALFALWSGQHRQLDRDVLHLLLESSSVPATESPPPTSQECPPDATPAATPTKPAFASSPEPRPGHATPPQGLHTPPASVSREARRRLAPLDGRLTPDSPLSIASSGSKGAALSSHPVDIARASNQCSEAPGKGHRQRDGRSKPHPLAKVAAVAATALGPLAVSAAVGRGAALPALRTAAAAPSDVPGSERRRRPIWPPRPAAAIATSYGRPRRRGASAAEFREPREVPFCEPKPSAFLADR
jgi:hypothetical protein